MGLPSSRDVTLNPADPIPSTLLDKLQDQVIGMKRPSGWRWFAVAQHPAIESSAFTLTEDGILFPAAGTFSGLPLGLWQEGDRITGFAVMHLGTGVACTPAYVLKMNTGSGAPATLGTLTLPNPPPATFTKYSLLFDGLSGRPNPQILPANASLYLNETGALQVSNKLLLVGIQSDRL